MESNELTREQTPEQIPEPPANEYLEIVMNGFPITLAIIAEMIIMTINISYLSDASAKAGLGLSGVLMHSFGGSFIFGFNYGFATFASRAFGARNLAKFKLFVVQGLLNLLALLSALVLISMFSYRIMLAAGQEELVSLYTSDFLIYILPGFVAFYFAHYIKSLLQAQEIIRPIMLVDGAAMVFHIVATHLLSHFVQESRLVILSTNLTFILSLVLTLLVEKRFAAWRFELAYFAVADKFEDFRYFLTECSYIAMPVALDMFVFEFMMLFIGYFQNTPETTAHVIVTNLFVMIASVYIGFTSYMGTKIGNHIGKNRPHEIKAIFWRMTKMVLLIIYLLLLLLYLFEDSIIAFYSDDPRVAAYIKPVIRFYAVFFVVDVVQFVLSVFYKSIGLGSWVIKMFALCFYAIGLTAMVLLTGFLETKIMSAWIGNLLGSVFLNYIYYKKWQEIDIAAITKELNSKVSLEEAQHSMLVPLKEMN